MKPTAAVFLLLLSVVACADDGSSVGIKAASQGAARVPESVSVAALAALDSYVIDGTPVINESDAAGASAIADINADATLLAQQEGRPDEQVFAIFFDGAMFQRSDGASKSAVYTRARILITEQGTVFEMAFWDNDPPFDASSSPFAPTFTRDPAEAKQ